MSWQDSTLGALTKLDGGLIQTGPFGSQLHQAEYEAEGVPVVMPKDITDGGISSETVARVSEQTATRLERHKLKPRSIVLPRRGEITKRAFISDAQDGWLCGTGCLKIELNGDHLVPEYLYYFMEQEHVTKWLLQHAVGSTMLNLSAGIVAAMPVRYPAINVQKAIAETLTTYDDLIDNNRRRMALLEDSARQLYREWFVRLRFPGHEHTPIVDGAPQGWERVRIDALGTVLTGKTPSTKDADNYGGDIPFIKTPDMHGNAFVLQAETYLSEKGAKLQENKFLPPGALLVSCIGTVGVVSITSELCQFNQQINAVIPVEDFLRYYSYFALKELKPRLDAIGGGVTMANVSKGKFESMDVLRPASTLLRSFDEFTSPVFNLIKILGQQNQKLRQARDLLLPRLMNGELAV
jgi:type I restriction enzyme S subunit